jgi:hypothetical protein
VDKVCTFCKVVKSEKDFHKSSVNGRQSYCKECAQIKARLYRYGVTVEEYNVIFEIQKGRCKICGIHNLESYRPLVVDHNHTTGKFRGLLCSQCNQGIGLLQDSYELCDKASAYLKESNK